MGGSKKNDEESLLEAIKFYQNGLIRYLERNDEMKMSHSLNKLSSYPIRLRHLKDTGVGRTVNLLSQKEGKVGEQARSLIAKWKLMVEQEEPKQEPEPTVEVAQESHQQRSSNTYKPEDHKSSSEKSYKNEYNSSEDENDMKLDSTGEDTRGSESSVSEEDKIYNSAKKHGSSHNRDDKSSSKHRSGEKEHSSHNKYSNNHENHHSSKHDKEHSSRREKEHSSKHDKSGSSRNEIEKSSRKIKEIEDIDDYRRNEQQSSSNDKNNRSKHEKDVSSRHDEKHSSRHDDKHSSKHNDKHSSRHVDKYSSKHKKENSSKVERKDKGEKDDSRRKDDKKHKEKDILDDKSNKSDRKGSDKEKSERSHKESDKSHKESGRSHSDKDNQQKKDERQRKERDEKSRENKIEEKSIKDEEKKPKSVKRNEEKMSTKYYPKEISSGSGTSFEEALGMMVIPSKEKKSHTKENASISKPKKSENHNSSKSPDNFEMKKSKTETKSDKKPKSSHRESEFHKENRSEKEIPKVEKKSEKKDKPSSSRHYTDEIPSTSGTSFEDALGMIEISKGGRKAVKRKSDNRENTSVGYEDSEICSSSGTTFEEALGMVEVPRKKRKLTDRSMDTSPVPVELDPLPVPLPSFPLERLDVAPVNLPQITPNYKPLLRVPDLPTAHNESSFVDNFMKNKYHRTKIYSGNKQTLMKVPTLSEICINLLQVHIDDMEATGGVPYYILKPVLEKATPTQLLRLEYYNSYLTEDTDELWQLHCQQDFRNKERQECESWREMYTRCVDEREARFQMLTASIKEAKQKSDPIRTTKIAYIDPPMGGPRRHRSTAVAVPTAKEKMAAIVRASKASSDVVVTHQRKASRSHAGPSTSSQSKAKKMAPLMAKAFSVFKNRRYKN